MKHDWQLWLNRNERVVGVAVVFQAGDYGLELKPNGLSDADRREWCKRLCDVLNEARAKGTL